MTSPDFRPKALFFDVFGTCVDWRKTVTDVLQDAASKTVDSPNSSIREDVLLAAFNTVRIYGPSLLLTMADINFSELGELSQRWRRVYPAFTQSIARDRKIPYKIVGQHCLHSLYKMLRGYGLILPSEESFDENNAYSSDRIDDGFL